MNKKAARHDDKENNENTSVVIRTKVNNGEPQPKKRNLIGKSRGLGDVTNIMNTGEVSDKKMDEGKCPKGCKGEHVDISYMKSDVVCLP